MVHAINPPEWFTLSEMADNYTHTFGAEKKSRNYSLFQTTQRRFFMLREGECHCPRSQLRQSPQSHKFTRVLTLLSFPQAF